VDSGVQVVTLAHREPVDVLAALEGLGLRNIFIEGGGQVAASFLKADLVDELVWFRAPILIGGEGRAGIADLGLERLSDALAFRRVEVREMGRDLMERYVRI
jgi:diaminohydroxyphosphoribosylaminopyrimidine deaminase/5-amino-6-(5-phosphoribosylamino)uracil reductase